MKSSFIFGQPKNPADNAYPAEWKVRRFLIDQDSNYYAETVPATERNIRASAVVYCVIGLLACISILVQVQERQPSRFWIYLACANLAGFGLRHTADQIVLPAGFLFLLFGDGRSEFTRVTGCRTQHHAPAPGLVREQPLPHRRPALCGCERHDWARGGRFSLIG
jgi:hypothetical protein